MWLSILLGIFIGAICYVGVMLLITLIKKKRAQKKKNSIEE